MIFISTKSKVIIKGFFLFSLFLLCACSSPRMISEKNVSQYEKSTGDLTTALSNLPRVNTSGFGRLAKITLSSGCKPTFLLNGQIELDYAYIYDIVEKSTLKTLRVQNQSDAALFGLRPGGSSLIVIETD